MNLNRQIHNVKQRIIDYCNENNLEFTECPRYIRINEPAISIEVKRLEKLLKQDSEKEE